MPKTITRTRRVVMEVEDCCVCGIPFAMSADYIMRKRETQDTFYCPNGHGQSYSESEADILRASLGAAKDQLAAANLRVNRLKEESRRQRVRASNGVCPCCNRSFVNLARHMAGQHPRYVNNGPQDG
jgi:hypothetical protein